MHCHLVKLESLHEAMQGQGLTIQTACPLSPVSGRKRTKRDALEQKSQNTGYNFIEKLSCVLWLACRLVVPA